MSSTLNLKIASKSSLKFVVDDDDGDDWAEKKMRKQDSGGVCR